MFDYEMIRIRRTQFLAVTAIAAGIIALSLATVKSFVLNQWARNRENVACVPVAGEYTSPMVYRQSFSHPVDEDAKVKTFVEQYVHLAYDEAPVNYYSVTNAQRYEKAKLSKSKWQAIEMTTGLAKEIMMKDYGASYERYKMISDTGVAWRFLIDDIDIKGIPNTGPIYAMVRGQYQVTYDQAKVDLPFWLYGYKEIRLLIIQGSPTKDGAGNDLNKSGLRVTWVQTEDMSAGDAERDRKSNIKAYDKSDENN